MYTNEVQRNKNKERRQALLRCPLSCRRRFCISGVGCVVLALVSAFEMGWPLFFVGPSTLGLGLSRRLQHPHPRWAFPSWHGLSCWACCACLGVPGCGWLFLAVLGTFHRYGRWDGFHRRGVSHPRHSARRAVVVVVVLSSLLSFRGCRCAVAVVVVLSWLSLCCRGCHCAVAVVVVLLWLSLCCCGCRCADVGAVVALLRCCHVSSVVMVGYAGIGKGGVSGVE